MGLVKELDDNTIGIRTVKGGAAISMVFKWVNDLHLFGAKFPLQASNCFDPIDNESYMVQVLCGG